MLVLIPLYQRVRIDEIVMLNIANLIQVFVTGKLVLRKLEIFMADRDNLKTVWCQCYKTFFLFQLDQTVFL